MIHAQENRITFRKKSRRNSVIIAAQYNSQYTDALVLAADTELRAAKALLIEIIRVPGSFEIPWWLPPPSRADGDSMRSSVLGAILRGQTSHAQQIADGVTSALALIQIESLVPIIHGVLLFENRPRPPSAVSAQITIAERKPRVALEMREVMPKGSKSQAALICRHKGHIFRHGTIWDLPMKISLKPHHLKLYKQIAGLLLKYGRSIFCRTWPPLRCWTKRNSRRLKAA